MKKGNFIEIIGTDLLIVILFVLPVIMEHSDPTGAMGAAYFSFIYVGPIVAALIGFMSGVVKRVPICTSIAVLVAGIVTMKLIKCMWLFVIVPFMAVYVGYLLGYVVRKCTMK